MKPSPPDDAVRRTALEWQVTLWSGEVTAEQRQAFEQWLNARPEHASAWQSVQRLAQTLHGSVPSSVAGKVLRAPKRTLARRNVLRGLGLAFSAGTVAYAVRGTSVWRMAAADYHTSHGEVRNLELPDGTRLTLNTASAIDVDFTPQARRIVLRAGEILVATAPDTAPVQRPFIVETSAGSIRALGTRFTVRQMEDDASAEIRVQVLDGAVEISSRDGGSPVRVNAGQQTRFSRFGVRAPLPADSSAASWSEGMLVAERQRLGDFLAELGRYRAGILRCEPGVADLTVSGVYPLHDTDAILQSLAQALPVRIRMATRYWVTVAAP